VYLTFVMERDLFTIAATLRNIRLSMLKPPPRSTEVPVQANDYEPAGVQAARFDFRVASIS